MDEPNILNIPAYQRKRSIAAKARNTRRSRAASPRASKMSEAKTKYHKPKTAQKRNPKTIQQENYSPLLEIPIRPMSETTDFYNDSVIPQFTSREPKTREMKTCGFCEGYFDKIDVAIIKVTSPIRKGDILIFEKQDGLFQQEITSMQINHKDVQLATTGSEIGMKVGHKPTVGGQVYKIID